ncbi:MAG TPA: hypothetical protein DDW78_05650 [Treponema sp.]|nr:hypothetical protein [Treponema sp.]
MIRRKLIITIAALTALGTQLFAKGDTYIYDVWQNIEHSPDVYRVADVFYAKDLGIGTEFVNPSSLFCRGNTLYLVDSGNNRILEFSYGQDKSLSFVRSIDQFTAPAGIVSTFASPSDVYVGEDGSFFVADTNNGRVVRIDANLNYMLSFTEPNDPTYEEGKTFLPEKVVADSKGRAYVLAKNVNKGFIKYEDNGTFTGFYGASDVTYDWTDYLWKKLSTRAQREQMESFVPTEYSNAYLDKDGFIYAVLKTFKPQELLNDQAKPIRRLNALGGDILIKNWDPPVGDLQWGTAAGQENPSHFNDITVLDNEVYIALDESRGRLFAYDNQGELLFAFGNPGNIDGFFRMPVSIEHCGRDLFVLDQASCTITLFSPTQFGDYIYNATELYADGEYDLSAAEWDKVMRLNGNYDLAYAGLGKARLRQNQYKEAMDYFRVKRFKRYYSKAFMYYRKEWIEKNLGWVLAVLCAIVFIPFIVRGIKSFKRELESL